MKKLFSLVLVLLMTGAFACAEAPETRTRTIATEFENYEITETNSTYENFSLWYQADWLKMTDYYGHPDFRPVGADEEDRSTSYLIVKAEITPEQAENMIIEAVGGYDDTWTIDMHREFETDSGNRVLSVDANNGLEIHRYYIVIGEADCLCITAMYPADIDEEKVFFFDLMTQTIEFISQE